MTRFRVIGIEMKCTHGGHEHAEIIPLIISEEIGGKMSNEYFFLF